MNPSAGANELRLAARLAERGVLRYTPARVAALDVRFAHSSTQVEAGAARKVELELPGVALGDVAKLLAGAPLGSALQVKGFLAARSVRTKSPVLHVTAIEFEEQTDHGIQTEKQTQERQAS